MILSFVEEHADSASFLWSQRASARRSPLYDLTDLTALDDRIEAHLDGLRVAGPTGLEVAVAAVADDDPGTIFTASVLALEEADVETIGAVLDTVARSPLLEAAFVAACDWVPLSTGERFFALLSSRGGPPGLRRLGVEAYAAHRHHPGEVFTEALAASEPDLRAATLRAVGALGLHAWVHAVSEHMNDANRECARWAAWSTALLGVRGHAHGVSATAAARRLCEIALDGPAAAADGFALALRILPAPEGQEWLRTSAARGVDFPSLCAGIAASGDAGWAPFLIDCLADVGRRRLAAQTLTDLLGVEVLDHESADPPASPTEPNEDPNDPHVGVDAQEGWPWPDVDNFGRACEVALRTNGSVSRLTRGRPREPAWSRTLLADADQRTRDGASLDVAMATAGPVFPIAAPAVRQRRALLSA